MPFGPGRFDGGGHAGEALPEIGVGERVVRMDAAVEVGGVQDRQDDGGNSRRSQKRGEGDDGGAPHARQSS